MKTESSERKMETQSGEQDCSEGFKWSNLWAEHSREIFDSFTFNEFADATIYCEGKRIPVHRLILSSASNYFHEMLNSSQTSHPVLIFENVNLSLLELLLMFIYRGEVLVHAKDTCSLFKLANELQIRGLSGSIGSDFSVKRDFDPPEINLINVNTFRKCLNPTKIRNETILGHKMKQMTNKSLCKKIGDSLLCEKKISKVKDNKYKTVGCNRTRIYKEEVCILPESPETTEDQEIYEQLSSISLVEDSSETFTEEAVKDLVVRLTSELSFKEKNSINKALQQEHQEEPHSQEPTQPEQSQQQVQQEKHHSQEPIQPEQSQQQVQEDLSVSDSESKGSFTKKSLNDDDYYENETIADPFSIEERMQILVQQDCSSCGFRTMFRSQFRLHNELHSIEKYKWMLERLGKERLLSLFVRLKRITRLRYLEEAKMPPFSFGFSPSSSKLNYNELIKKNIEMPAFERAVLVMVKERCFLSGSLKAYELMVDYGASTADDSEKLFHKQRLRKEFCVWSKTGRKSLWPYRVTSSRREYHCSFCTHRTYNQKDFLTHHKSHDRGLKMGPIHPEDPYQCENCDYETFSPKCLEDHGKFC